MRFGGNHTQIVYTRRGYSCTKSTKRKYLFIDKETINFLWPVNTDNESFFNIGSAAWACSKTDQRREVIAIPVSYQLQSISHIINKLLCICNANMDRGINTCSSSAGLKSAKNNAACSCHQCFA